MRPDEMAAAAEIERDKNFRGKLRSGAGAISSAVTPGLGIGIGSKIAPFLSEYIPTDLALKGINKVAPKVGQFLERGMKSGLDVKDGLNFIKEKFVPESSNTKEHRNIIEQYDPELHTYILGKMKKGKTHLEAGRKALGHGRFKRAIDKITKDHKQNWTSILESVYGQQMAPKEQPPPQQQQQGQDNSALLAILQKLHAATGAQ